MAVSVRVFQLLLLPHLIKIKEIVSYQIYAYDSFNGNPVEPHKRTVVGSTVTWRYFCTVISSQLYLNASREQMTVTSDASVGRQE